METEGEFIRRVVKGNESAAELFERLMDVMDVWDNLIDGDAIPTPAEIHGAMFYALIGLPRNTFYAQNKVMLEPLIINSITNWRLANDAEREQINADDLQWAFVIRSSYVDILLMCATLIGGPEWAVEIGGCVRRMVHRERFSGYVDALQVEKTKREARHGTM